MRPTRDVALRTGIYLTAAISGLAAAYVLREWIYHLWDAPTPNDEKPPPSVTSDTEHGSLHTDELTYTPSASQIKSLPPSLPPTRSDAQASSDPTSPTTKTVFAGLNGNDGVEEDVAHSNISIPDPLMDVMSPHPPRVIMKRRSMRAHDLFSESHISFSELGSFVAPPSEPE